MTSLTPFSSPRPPAAARLRRAFTLMELMLVLLIISITSVLSVDLIADFEAGQRADRAAREALSLFRFARNVAMTTGKNAKVVVSTTNKTLSIYWMSNGTTWDATPMTTGMTSTGTWVLNMSSRELAGTTIALNPVGTTDFIYGALGACAQTGTISFTYGGKTKSLAVKNVGDPALQ